MPHEPTQLGEREGGFSVIDMVMGLLVMTILMTSLTYVLINSLSDVAYSRQRTTALALANQAIEEVRSLPAATIEQGMLGSTDPTWSRDPNVAGKCFEGKPLDVDGTPAVPTCGATSWSTPTCSSVATGAPTASSLASPAPLSPHLACYSIDGRAYGLAVYLTGDPSALPLKLWAVVWWVHPVRGQTDHVVTSLSLSDCLLVGETCGT